MKWPKAPTIWIENRTLYASIPFTWDLPKMRNRLMQRSIEWDTAIVGGPGVYLMPSFFDGMDHVSIGYDFPGVLQRVNPMATRTTTGCVRRCPFCAVRTIEGRFKELDDWPNLPILADNNLLAAGREHFDRVIDRLKQWGWADFNQGLDARLLSSYHAHRIAEIKKPIVRLALDSINYAEQWGVAFDVLREAGITLKSIRSYALIGFDSDPSEAWQRCEWIEKHGIKVLPMWFHALDQLEKNIVTDAQAELGWNDYERRRIMQWLAVKRRRHESKRGTLFQSV